MDTKAKSDGAEKVKSTFLSLFAGWMKKHFEGLLVGLGLGIIGTLFSGAHLVFGK